MPTALLSVTDKRGLSQLASRLAEAGWTLLASGGTAAHLRDSGLTVREVSDVTGATELLDGRVKTLHPAIHAGILSRRTPADEAELARQGWTAIDLVVANLYPFEEAPEIENIDIGGVALLRAAAKNFEHVSVVCDPSDYLRLIGSLPQPDLETRRALAAKAFTLCSRYDAAIASSLAPPPPASEGSSSSLRYGENPHQKAHLLTTAGPLGGRLLSGKELSYNNLLDGDTAWRGVETFEGPAVCVVKHASPCGLALAQSPRDALRAALECDRVSAFGGVIACNHTIDLAFVEELGDLFIEGLLAPAFEPEALSQLASRQSLRLLEMALADPNPEAGEFRSIRAGMLWQERDAGELCENEWRVASQRSPSEQEMESLRFAWQAVRHVRSNAIVLAWSTATVGIGGGQPNRVDALRIAIRRAGDRAAGSVLASDGFFPFADSVQLAAQAGITAVIQPGGSVRDEESIAACDQHGLAMVVTGRRHFRH